MASDLKNSTVLLFSSDPVLAGRLEQADSMRDANFSVVTYRPGGTESA